jgi:hypothetical protein
MAGFSGHFCFGLAAMGGSPLQQKRSSVSVKFESVLEADPANRSEIISPVRAVRRFQWNGETL